MTKNADLSPVITYDGNLPYIFISYAHRDTNIVIPIIHAMQAQGYRIWLDQGIEAGTEWSNNIAAHLRDCSVFLAFISHNSVASENCLDEIAYAKAKRKVSLMIFLEEDVRLPEGTEMQTARFQRIFFSRHRTVENFIREIQKTSLLDSCRDIPVAEPADQPKPSPEPEAEPEPKAPVPPVPKPKPKRKPVPRPPKAPKAKKPLRLLFPVMGLGVLAILAVLLFVFLSGPKETLTQIPGDDSYTLIPAGQINDPEGLLSITSSCIKLDTATDKTFILTDYLGNPVSTLRCSGAEYLGQGLYAAMFPAAQDANVLPHVNNTALVTVNGDILVPPECAQIRFPSSRDSDNCRYLLVYYATGQIESKDEALITAGDAFYSGYIKIFDVDTGAFVEGLPRITDAGTVKICGDSLVVKDKQGNSTLYSSTGKPTLEVSGTVETGDGILVYSDKGTYRVYDQGGTQLYYSNKYLNVFSGGRYLSCKLDGQAYSILNADGSVLTEKSYDSITLLSGGYFSVKSNGKAGLLSPDGTEVVPCQYDYIYESGLPDFYYGRYRNNYCLIGPNGIIATKLKSAPSSLVAAKDDALLVINTGSYSANPGSGHPAALLPALVVGTADTTGLYGVYDLFTGNLILPCEYEKIQYSSGYLYALKAGVWEAFEIQYSQGDT